MGKGLNVGRTAIKKVEFSNPKGKTQKSRMRKIIESLRCLYELSARHRTSEVGDLRRFHPLLRIGYSDDFL
jgi:hypothetical protein